jgi:hypothetical protein
MDKDVGASGAPYETVLAQFGSRRVLVVGDLMLDRLTNACADAALLN